MSSYPAGADTEFAFELSLKMGAPPIDTEKLLPASVAVPVSAAASCVPPGTVALVPVSVAAVLLLGSTYPGGTGGPTSARLTGGPTNSGFCWLKMLTRKSPTFGPSDVVTAPVWDAVESSALSIVCWSCWMAAVSVAFVSSTLSIVAWSLLIAALVSLTDRVIAWLPWLMAHLMAA